jgi:hypothetical protein
MVFRASATGTSIALDEIETNTLYVEHMMDLFWRNVMKRLGGMHLSRIRI